MMADSPGHRTPSPVRIAALGAEILDAGVLSRRLAALAMSRVAAQDDRTAGVLDALTRIADAAQAMAEVALQTRLLAFNLSVEAARQEPAGGSLGLMARAVTDLSHQVEAGCRQIADTSRRFESHLATDPEEGKPDPTQEPAAIRALEALQEAIDRMLACASELRSIR